MSYLLELSEVSFSYNGSVKPILHGLDLKVRGGESIAILGANGAGKTTLAMIIAGVLKPDSGKVIYCGANIFDEAYRAKAGEVGLMFQDPADGILATTVEREIAFTPENAQLPAERIRAIVDGLARDFDLLGDLRKNIDELSGGSIERCALAASMAADPRLLILDEPDAFLDVEGKRLFWEKIDGLKRAGTAIIYITQSVESAGKCDDMLILEGGSLRRERPEALPIEPIRHENPKTDEFFELRGIYFSFDSKRILAGINLKVRRGERIAIFGPNGSGKTTLARVFAGLYRPDTGEIAFAGEALGASKMRIAVSFQFPAKQLFAETVLEDVAFGPRNLGLENPLASAREALSSVGLGEEFYQRSPFKLSDGQQRWVGIAGVLAMKPDFILFDEPTASLDSAGKRRFRDIIEALSRDGVTVAIITHDFDFAVKCAQRAVFMESGRIAREIECDPLSIEQAYLESRSR